VPVAALSGALADKADGTVPLPYNERTAAALARQRAAFRAALSISGGSL
jgi:hypothetical protein